VEAHIADTEDCGESGVSKLEGRVPSLTSDLRYFSNNY